jgi:hypothetical protein
MLFVKLLYDGYTIVIRLLLVVIGCYLLLYDSYSIVMQLLFSC